jgi:hypothetical protein
LAARDDEPSPGLEPGDGTLGRIALKQVRVKRNDIQERRASTKTENPGNALVPYLDLFSRLEDEELARLAGTKVSVVHQLRTQIDEINKALERYVDLLPRLSDNELNRLTGASAKTIRFWRLCQPRVGGEAPGPAQRSKPAGPKSEAAAPKAKPRHTQSASGTHTPGVPADVGVSRTPPPVSTAEEGQGVAQAYDPTTDRTPDPSASQRIARSQLSSIEGAPFPGFDSGQAGPDEGGEVEIGLLDDADEAQVEQTGEHDPVEDDDEDDDLAFELSDDDFF